MSQVRALLLDLGDTLFRLHPFPVDLPARIAARTAIPLPTAESVVLRMGDSAATVRDHAEADLVQLASLACGAAGIGPSERMVRAIAEEFHLADIRRFQALPSIATSMSALKATGVRICAVSNTTTPPAMLRSYLAAIGIERCFDAFVFSIEEGVKKPHERIYAMALQRLSASPSEALFVGDRVLADVVGPGRLGIRAVLTHEYRQEDPGDARPVAVIRRLDEVAGLIADRRSASGE